MTTLNETLSSLGYTTEPAGNYRKRILRDGVEVFSGTAHDVWEWLRETSQDPACSTCGHSPALAHTSHDNGGAPWWSCAGCLTRDLCDTAALDPEILSTAALVRQALRLGPVPRIHDTIPAPMPPGFSNLDEPYRGVLVGRRSA